MYHIIITIKNTIYIGCYFYCIYLLLLLHALFSKPGRKKTQHVFNFTYTYILQAKKQQKNVRLNISLIIQ